MESDYGFLDIMHDFLNEKGKLTPLAQGAIDKQEGKKLDLSTHVKYMIYAQLSNGEKWINVEKNIRKIDTVFFGYNIQEIKKHKWEYFYENIKPLIVRGVSLKGQMKYLHKNIETLEKIENDGGLDDFIHSKPPRKIVELFTGKFKLHSMGVSLVCEYLKSVGVSCVKPDVHVMRFLSKTRRGFLDKPGTRINKKGEIKDTNWTIKDKYYVLELIENMSLKCGKSETDIDRIIWSFCADGHGEICTKMPKCKECPVRVGCFYERNRC